MSGQFIVLGLLILFTGRIGVTGLQVIPSLAPLKYITPDNVINYITENFESNVWSSLLPVDQQDALAIFISEGVSGFLGGVALKGVSLIDGNRNNRESSLANAETSGLYFGSTAAIRSLAQLAGLSSITVNLVAVSLAALFSEVLKIRRRSISPLRTRVGSGPTMYELMKFKNPSMLDLMKFAKDEQTEITPRMKMMGPITETEIVADLAKWIVFSLFVPRTPMAHLEDAVTIGTIAGFFSQVVREKKDAELSDQIALTSKQRKMTSNKGMLSTRIVDGRTRSSFSPPFSFLPPMPPMPPMPSMPSPPPKDYTLLRFARSCLESAVQLLTYEAARRYVMEVSPYFQEGGGFQSLLMAQ
eukprot:gene34964-42341_t